MSEVWELYLGRECLTFDINDKVFKGIDNIGSESLWGSDKLQWNSQKSIDVPILVLYFYQLTRKYYQCAL